MKLNLCTMQPAVALQLSIIYYVVPNLLLAVAFARCLRCMAQRAQGSFNIARRRPIIEDSRLKVLNALIRNNRGVFIVSM